MSDSTLLSVRDLSVRYQSKGGPVDAVQGVNLEVQPGKMTAIVGESGSGKSTTALASLGLLPRNASVTAGSIEILGEDTSRFSQRQWRALRGQTVALIPQDPTNSLNPLKTIGASVEEGMAIHRVGSAASRKQRAIELLERVGIDDPERRYNQYPHELSGGMRQRVLIAAAVALEPKLIVADEPTSALDVTVQKVILDLLDEMREELGLGILLITHDLAVAGDRADYVVVMQHGQVRESGLAVDVLTDPQHNYSKILIADAPSLNTAETFRTVPAADTEREILLSVKDFGQDFGDFTAVDQVSFEVARGTTHAIVGESGSGKTTTGRAIAGFHKPSRGQIFLGSEAVHDLDRAALREFRRKVQLVYQNPYSSLDPRFTIGQTIGEPLKNFGLKNKTKVKNKVAEMLDLVSLDPALESRRPAELSGGQRQRVAIARAIVVEPELIVLDEAVSALDVTVQSQILRLLDRLQAEMNLTYVFISHDLAVVRQISDTVSVMKSGAQVEQGSTHDVFQSPQTDYTRDLLAAIPGSHFRGGDLNLGL